MPTGVYERTPAMLKMAKECLALGRTPAVRKRAAKTQKQNAKDPEWRRKVAEATQAAMHRPEVRKRHLKGLRKAIETHGPNFKGGNGQARTDIIKILNKILRPHGFLCEYIIKTKRHTTHHKPPDHYKADFAHPDLKIVIEVDGAYHRTTKQQEFDQRKTEVLESLGWVVKRARHGQREPNPDTIKRKTLLKLKQWGVVP